MTTTLANKTILITGASSGIGEACALMFAEQGARLILCGRREERLQALQNKLVHDYKIPAHTLVLDVRDRVAVKETISSLPEDFKNIDILINNAGGALGLETLATADLDDWDTMIDANIKGVLYLIHAVLPGMYTRKTGHIVNIGSTAAHITYRSGSVYCATKHAVDAISKTLSLESINTGVRVTQIDPGMVETEFSLVRFKGDAEKAKSLYENFKPLSAKDVADTIYYAITRPPHVNISEIILYSREQAANIPC
jgi:3-hydroxy acid dehydrogenase/malonic semialdehyde reductase